MDSFFLGDKGQVKTILQLFFRYDCDFVVFIFQNLRGFDNHMESAHDTYVCPTPSCGKIFRKTLGNSAKGAYERHLKTRCGKPGPLPQFACSGEFVMPDIPTKNICGLTKRSVSLSFTSVIIVMRDSRTGSTSLVINAQ